MGIITRAVHIGVLMLVSANSLADCSALDNTHGKWSAILGEYVTGGQLDYHALKTGDRAALDDYLGDLSSACAPDYVAASTEEKLAFWINAYNAFTIALILDHYPIASIRKIGWLPGAAFRESFIPMANLKGGNIFAERHRAWHVAQRFRRTAHPFCTRLCCTELSAVTS